MQLPDSTLIVAATVNLDYLKPEGDHAKGALRLPKTLSVDSYDITLTPQAEEDYFEGETTIHMTAQESGNRIVMHSKFVLRLLDLSSIFKSILLYCRKLLYDLHRLVWAQVGNTTVAISGVEFDASNSLLTLTLEEPFLVSWISWRNAIKKPQVRLNDYIYFRWANRNL